MPDQQAKASAAFAPTRARCTASSADGPQPPDRVRQYVEQYDGGDCFSCFRLRSVRARPVIEGFGTSTSVRPFDKASSATWASRLRSASRLVTQAQCPAIKFLSQLGGNQARAPRINLSVIEVKNGDTLNGTIENFANRVVELLLVSDSGEVQNLSYLLKPGNGSLSFSIGMQRSGERLGRN